jgi:threonine/homoserine efflux transporter RhtA
MPTPQFSWLRWLRDMTITAAPYVFVAISACCALFASAFLVALFNPRRGELRRKTVETVKLFGLVCGLMLTESLARKIARIFLAICALAFCFLGYHFWPGSR